MSGSATALTSTPIPLWHSSIDAAEHIPTIANLDPSLSAAAAAAAALTMSAHKLTHATSDLSAVDAIPSAFSMEGPHPAESTQLPSPTDNESSHALHVSRILESYKDQDGELSIDLMASENMLYAPAKSMAGVTPEDSVLGCVVITRNGSPVTPVVDEVDAPSANAHEVSPRCSEGDDLLSLPFPPSQEVLSAATTTAVSQRVRGAEQGIPRASTDLHIQVPHPEHGYSGDLNFPDARSASPGSASQVSAELDPSSAQPLPAMFPDQSDTGGVTESEKGWGSERGWDGGGVSTPTPPRLWDAATRDRLAPLATRPSTMAASTERSSTAQAGVAAGFEELPSLLRRRFYANGDMQHVSSQELPSNMFCCQASGAVFGVCKNDQPVLIPCGHTLVRKELAAVLASSGCCPLCALPLPHPSDEDYPMHYYVQAAMGLLMDVHLHPPPPPPSPDSLPAPHKHNRSLSITALVSNTLGFRRVSDSGRPPVAPTKQPPETPTPVPLIADGKLRVLEEDEVDIEDICIPRQLNHVYALAYRGVDHEHWGWPVVCAQLAPQALQGSLPRVLSLDNHTVMICSTNQWPTIAVKFRLVDENSTSEDLQLFHEEKLLLNQFRDCPYIVGCLGEGRIEDDDTLAAVNDAWRDILPAGKSFAPDYLVMQCPSGGTFSDAIEAWPGELDDVWLQGVLRALECLARALERCHPDVPHGAIRPDHLLFDEGTGNWQLASFNLRGTQEAREDAVLCGRLAEDASWQDVYHVGSLLYSVFTQKTSEFVVERDPKAYMDVTVLPADLPAVVPVEVCKLMIDMWSSRLRMKSWELVDRLETLFLGPSFLSGM